MQSFDTCTVNPTTIAWTNIGSPYATASYYRDQLGIVVVGGRPTIEDMRAGAHLTREGHRDSHITPHDLSPLGPKAAHAEGRFPTDSPTVSIRR